MTGNQGTDVSDALLIRACESANQDEDVVEIEKDLDAIDDEIAE